MDAEVVLVLTLIVGFAVVWAVAIVGSIDALGQPREAWERAEFRRITWVWQGFAVFCLPAALAYSGLYFVRVRPRLVAAARDLAIERYPTRGHLPLPQLPAGAHIEKIKMRIPLSVAGAIALPVLAGYAVGFGMGALSAGAGGSFPWHLWIVWGLVLVLVAVGNLTFGVTLTPHELVMRGLTRRHVAWSDVVAITQESMLGSRYVRLWTRTGRRRRLRAPVTQLGVGRRRFDADFAILEQWWLSHTPAVD